MLKIATMSVFGYPDSSLPGKYLFTHEQAKALSCFAEVHAFDLGADNNLYKAITEETYENIRVFRFPKILRKKSDVLIKMFRFMQYRRELMKILSANNYDLLLFSFIDPRYLLFLFPFRNAKTALTAHGFDALISYDNRLLGEAKKWLLRKVDLIFPVSDFTAQLVNQNLPHKDLKKVHIIYNGINQDKLLPVKDKDKAEIRSKIGIRSDKFILTICNLVERKGVDIALRADKYLKEKGYDFTHMIVGKGLLKNNLKVLAEELGLKENILFKDRLLDHEIGEFYKAADVFVMISKNLPEKKEVEGFGIVFAEAGFLGVPVVAGNSGGVPSVVKHGINGILVDPGGAEPEKETAEYIEKLFTEPGLWKVMSRESELFACRNFDWKLNAGKILNVLTETR